jgi:acetolactate synthase-1/2/3 large subunit
MKKDDIFLMSNGSACVCPFQTAVIKKGQRFILNSGDASMGFGLPAAIGACVSADKRNVICLEGDGSIMMNIQELQTIKHNNLPVKIFVLNNNGYISIKQTQKNFFEGRMTGAGEESGVSVPDFVAVGEAFGLKSVKIDDNKKMTKQIKEILALNEPVLVNVKIKTDYGFAPKLSARKLDDGTMISPSLEDMFPFLDRDEFEENIIK